MIRDVTAIQARKALLSKGFCAAEHYKGRDHEMFFFEMNKKKTAFLVKISHGADKLRVDEIKHTARKNMVLGDDIYRILCCEFDAQQTLEVYRRSRWAQR